MGEGNKLRKEWESTLFNKIVENTPKGKYKAVIFADEITGENIDELIRIIERGNRRLFNQIKVRRLLHLITLQVSMGLYEERHMKPASVGAQLRKVEAALRATIDSIIQLDREAQRLLANSADKQEARPPGDNGETIWQWLEPSQEIFGPQRVEWVLSAMKDCETWAKDAMSELGAPRKGRPSAKVAREAVEVLAEMWNDETGERPTIVTDRTGTKRTGDFVDFCEAFLLPQWQGLGLDPPAVAEVAHSVLYRSKGKKPE